MQYSVSNSIPLLWTLISCSFAYNQVLRISEASPYNNHEFNGIIVTRSQSNINNTLSTTVSLGIRGMWQIHDGVSGKTGYTCYYTEGNDLGTSHFVPEFRHITDVRRLGGSELTEVGLSLYENSISTYPFGGEHHFTRGAWTGEPFPLSMYAVTGRSSWTVFERSDYKGTSYCLRTTHLYTWGERLLQDLPLVVGSVIRGCDPNKIQFEVYLKSPLDSGTIYA